MPTYDYQCRSCGSTLEVIHSMLETGPTVCERCGGELRRVLYPAGIIFKGSGFYRTDSRANGSGDAAPKSDTPKESTSSATSTDAGSSSSSSASSSTKSAESSTT